jgi:hypothetical protein
MMPGPVSRWVAADEVELGDEVLAGTCWREVVWVQRHGNWVSMDLAGEQHLVLDVRSDDVQCRQLGSWVGSVAS